MDQCTGCGLCSKICPGKKGEKAIKMTDVLTLKKNGMIDMLTYLEKNVTEKHPLSPTTIKGSQFIEPKFKFPGACAPV